MIALILMQGTLDGLVGLVMAETWVLALWVRLGATARLKPWSQDQTSHTGVENV